MSIRLIRFIFLIMIFGSLFAGDENSITKVANEEGINVKYVDIGPEGTLFIAKGEDGLSAYRYEDSTLTQIALVRHLAADIFNVKAGENNMIFTLSDQGIDAFYFTGSAFIHKAHQNSTGETIDVKFGNTVFLVDKYFGIRTFHFQDNNFIRTAEVNAYERTGYLSFDIEITSDSTVFLANYWGGLKFYKYTVDSLIFLGGEWESEWTFWPYFWGESGASGVAIIGDTAVIVTSFLTWPYLYIYKDDCIVKRMGQQGSAEIVPPTYQPKISVIGDKVLIYYYRHIVIWNYTGRSIEYSNSIGEIQADVYNVVCDTNGVIYCALGEDGLAIYETTDSGYVKTVQTAIDNNSISTFKLDQNYPNPFNPITTIEYAIPEDSNVRLDIYNISGQLVETLVDKYHQTGAYKVKWDASKYSSGVYIYSLEYGNQHIHRKMLLIK